jgi:hypothetical protein
MASISPVWKLNVFVKVAFVLLVRCVIVLLISKNFQHLTEPECLLRSLEDFTTGLYPSQMNAVNTISSSF